MPSIGEIWWLQVSFYNKTERKMDFKVRPALVIAQADSEDFVVLPVSKIDIAEKRHPIYDIPVAPEEYGLLNLNKKYCSFIRTHKQTVVHKGEFSGIICGNVKELYAELYTEIVMKREEFSNEITTQALQ